MTESKKSPLSAEEKLELARNWWSTSIIDMKPGVIRMRGYAIEDLIGAISFPQMIWLMLRGDLPNPGQARLLELADVPAHFVKFDISLIRGLHNASPRKRQLVRDLVQMVLATGSVPLAEGVEDEAEAQACIEMGFRLIQGYLTGRPVPLDAL